MPGRSIPRWRLPRVAALLAAALLVGATPLVYPHYARFHPMRPAYDGGVAAARQLVACARAWSAAHAGAAPADLGALGTGDARCRVAARGWRVAYAPEPSRPGGFGLVVRERVAPFTVYRSIATDEAGALHVAERMGDATTADPFLTDVPAELSRIGQCIANVVESRPGRELPVSLAELGPRGEGCVILEGARWGGDSAAVLTVGYVALAEKTRAAEERYRFTYSLAADSAGVPRPRVDARPVRYPVDGVRSYALLGDTVRATADDRPADAGDTTAARCEAFRPVAGCPRPEWLSWTRLDARPAAAAVLPARDSSVPWSVPLGIRPAEGTLTRPTSPAIGPDGTAYAASRGGIYAFAAGGERRWARPELAIVDGGGVALAGTQLVATTRDSGVVALDPATGTTRWASRAVPGVLAFVPVALPGDAIAVGNQAGALTVLEPDGRVRWTKRLGSRLYSAPAVDGRGTMYLLADGRETELVAIDARGKEHRRTRVGGWSAPPLLLADGTALVASGAGLFAIDARGGPARKLAGSAEDADVLVARADGSILFLDSGRLVAMAPNGRRLWSYQSADRPTGVAGPAILADGTIVLADASFVRGLSAAGDSLWAVPYKGDGKVSTPVVGPDGTIYVIDARWRLTAVRPPGAKVPALGDSTATAPAVPAARE